LIFDYISTLLYKRYNSLEYPPLWVWGIIVGIIIGSKFIYRWQATKSFAKEAEQRRRRRRKIESDDKTKDLRNNDFYDNINNYNNATNIRTYRYSPSRYYKNYFAIKKKKNME
jgi:hypothetical protein